jgi:nucleolar protein 12
LQRCKTVPSGPSAAKSKPSTASSAASGKVTRGEKRANPPKPAATPISIPAGDPTLGARLASLSKEDRKAAKAADTDRLARRAAKKAAKSAKAKSDKMQRKDIGDINKGRKKKGPGAARKEVKKRVLSERAVGKRNVKK